MNELGIVSYTYLGYSVKDMARDMALNGLTLVQLDPRQPGVLEGYDDKKARAREVCEIFAEHGVRIVALSGYCNLSDPDPKRRAENISMLDAMLEMSSAFGTALVATETGSRHPSNQWADHPENHTAEAWEELLQTVEHLQKTAVACQRTILIEGYVNNVINTPAAAHRLIEELGGDGLGCILDACNYMTLEDLEAQHEALDRIFGEVAEFAPVAHAKDVVYTPKGISTPRPGKGELNWPEYAKRLAEHPAMPLLLEHLQPEDIEECVAFVKKAFDGGR